MMKNSQRNRLLALHSPPDRTRYYRQVSSGTSFRQSRESCSPKSMLPNCPLACQILLRNHLLSFPALGVLMTETLVVRRLRSELIQHWRMKRCRAPRRQNHRHSLSKSVRFQTPPFVLEAIAYTYMEKASWNDHPRGTESGTLSV